ncbi:MAG: cyclodeaminase/cyclohydrolase family protein [Corallococcus sp.]|nr:cyclodeaminase/cyclohydrolase family protein [Corallococcus sp.]MCM1359899.1 cyclodeaminase/cyclohydrolase family protein [Corallococcus sp.]MCM1395333.1 cyclodeaminase/cyclohydrolase family protein [Corallococcus sp.]
MFEKMTIEEYNKILASKAPTPGGGSALAIVGTIACSLVEMSVNVTLAKLKEDDEVYIALSGNASFFARARAKLQQLSDEDAAAFRHIVDCMHLPKDTPERQNARNNELQKAYHKAALVPLDVMQVCCQALQSAQNKVLPLVYKYVASDCKIGIDLFANIIENSMENVYANTCLITDTILRSQLESQGKEILTKSKTI